MKLLTLLLFIILASCKSRVMMPDMLGNNEVDITYLINKGYKAVYCEGKIIKIINPNPSTFNNSELDQINKSIAATNESINREINITTPHKFIYIYSYLIYESPVDVYMGDLISGEDSIKVYVRKNADSLILPVSNINWVTSSCD